jgi:hypothetical protein
LTGTQSEVLAVGRLFLECRPAEFPLELLVPELAERAAIIRSIPVTWELVGYYPKIRRLELVAVDGDVAICICDASFRAEHLEGNAGVPRVSHETISGKLKLVRSGGRWQIADYSRWNIPVRSTFKLYHGEQVDQEDLTIIPLLLERGLRSVHLACEVQNHNTLPARITRLGVRVGSIPGLQWRRGVIHGDYTVRAGAPGRIDAAAGGPRLIVQPLLEFRFTINTGGRLTHIPVAVPGLTDPG